MDVPRHRSHALTLVIYAIILAPKIPLLVIAGESAGIRLDDLLMWGLGLPLLLSDRRLAHDRLFGAAALFALCCVPSLLLGGTAFYPLRLFQYAMIIPMAAAAGLDPRRLAFVTLWVNGLACVLQYAGLIGDFSTGVYSEPYFGARAAGTTGGPYEAAACANIAAAFILSADWRHRLLHRRDAWLAFIIGGITCVCAASRSGVVVHVIIFGIYFACTDRFRLAVVAALVVGVAGWSASNGATVARIDADALTSVTEIGSVGSEPIRTGDPSFQFRIQRWRQALEVFKGAGWPAAIFGVGMGRFGPALDGGWLRIMCETGAVGMLGFVVLLVAMTRRLVGVGTPLVIAALPVLALAGNQVFIDAYIASKLMTLLFVLLGSLRHLDALDMSSSSRYSTVRPPVWRREIT